MQEAGDGRIKLVGEFIYKDLTGILSIVIYKVDFLWNYSRIMISICMYRTKKQI